MQKKTQINKNDIVDTKVPFRAQSMYVCSRQPKVQMAVEHTYRMERNLSSLRGMLPT